MKHKRILATTLLLSLSSVAMAQKTQSEMEIEQIVNTFKSAIIDKDKETFESLFYSEEIPWVAVFSDEMVAARRETNPDFPRSINFGKFGPPVNMIADDESRQEEKIWDLQIDTDGYLGSVHFQYSDHQNGEKKAFGTEAWDLVKEDSGWKIVSVIYTVTEVAN